MAPCEWIHVEPELCRDCQVCALACSLYHEGECNPGLARVLVNKDMARYTFDIIICRHCDPPQCLAACPHEAMQLDNRGVVIIMEDRCDRCLLCAASCPFDAIFYNQAQDRTFKCDLCAGRQEGPLCVQICPVGALALMHPKAASEKV